MPTGVNEEKRLSMPSTGEDGSQLNGATTLENREFLKNLTI